MNNLLCNGQNSGKIDIRFNLSHLIPIGQLDDSFLNSTITAYPFKQPTILGNLGKIKNIEFGIAHRTLFKKFYPEIIVRYNKYYISTSNFYRNLSLRTYSVGLGVDKPLKVWKKLNISTYVNFFLGISELTSDENLVTVIYDNSTYFKIDYAGRKIRFMSPSFDLGGGIGYEITDRLSIEGRVGLNLINFPDFDISSPLFYKSVAPGLGLNFKLFKNKRFFLEE